MNFTPEFLDEIRLRLALHDVIGRKLKLVRRGHEYVGLCPFHNEKTPSFTVNEEKGFYHCFGCGAHGDVIRFVMETEGASFPETVEKLADQAGLSIPVAAPEERARVSRQAQLLRVMEAAAKWFEAQLAGQAGTDARAYLQRRQLSDEAIKVFRLGYAPERRNALGAGLTAQGFSEPDLVEGGLSIRPEDGSGIYDRFRNRVIFPIMDRRGRVIAFGGRALAQARAKYLNSPETLLFHKSDVLYNLHAARQPAHERGRVIVAEGYMDVIALHQAGFSDAVAPLGTALTESHLRQLWRLVPEPMLCFDGDEAGLRAAFRAIDRALPLLEPGQSLAFVLLPDGEDPDSLLGKWGARMFQERIDSARSLVDLLWLRETRGKSFKTPESRAGLEVDLEKIAGSIRNAKIRTYYLSDLKTRIARLFGPAQTSFVNRRSGPWLGPGRNRGGRNRWSGAASLLRASAGSGELVAKRLDQVFERREQVIVQMMLSYPRLLDDLPEEISSLPLRTPGLGQLRDAVLNYAAQNSNLETEVLVRHLNESEYADIVGWITARGAVKIEWFIRLDAAYEDVCTGFRHLLKRQHHALTLQDELRAACAELETNLTEQVYNRFLAIMAEIDRGEGDELDVEGFGEASGRVASA